MGYDVKEEDMPSYELLVLLNSDLLILLIGLRFNKNTLYKQKVYNDRVKVINRLSCYLLFH